MDVHPPGTPVLEEHPPAPASVPPVVAVMVTHDPGPWLEEALGALAAQDYPDLSVLIIDAASGEDPTARVAAALPSAYVRRLDHNPGYAAAANQVLEVVEGASHYVFLHDDAAPDPDAVRLMVEEAYRSNAGVVAPKLVSWDDPRLLLAVGAAADKAGVTHPFGRGELDQEQHDAVRDVFVAPGGCTLVRADLYAALEGFDGEMGLFGEDLDLSWRAQVAGARVVVSPAARVRHLEATAAGLRPLELAGPGPSLTDRVRPLELRHRLRSVLKCYGRLHLLRVVPQLLVLTVAELVFGLVTRRTGLSRAAITAWQWNAGHRADLRASRRRVQEDRALGDGAIRRLQTRGSARVTGFVRTQLAAEERLFGVAEASRELAGTLRRNGLRLTLGVWAAIAAVLLVGSRELLAGELPAVGQLVPFTDGPVELLRHYASGWRTAGLGSPSPAPAAFAVLGVAGTLVFGAMGLLQKLLVFGAIAAGVVGAWRLTLPLTSFRPRLVAVTLYAALPLPFDALANGRLSGVLAYGAMPWILRRLAQASGVAPFGAEPPVEVRRRVLGRTRAPLPPRVAAVDDVSAVLGPEAGTMDPIAAEEYLVGSAALGGVPHHEREPADAPAPAPPAPQRDPGRLLQQAVPAALLLALVAALVPSILVVALLTGVGLLAGSAVAGEARSGLRSLGLAAAAVGGAAVLLFPWTLELLTPGAGWGGFAGFGPPPGEGPSLADLLRFHTGPIGDGPLGYAFLGAAALPLLVGRGWRLAWAARLWMVALIAWAAAWVGSQGWLGLAPPTTDVLLAPAGVALALAAALGLSAFEFDLPGYRFGWRQVASIATAGAAVLALFPAIAGAVGGRWGLPERDVPGLLSWMEERQAEGAFRVLWLGRAEALPLDGWKLDERLAYGTSTNGAPDVTDLWPGSDEGATGLLADAVEQARQQRTTRLGRLLAPTGVRYLVVPTSVAPAIEGRQALPVPADLSAALLDQVDLRLLQVDDAVTVYENTAWAPVRAALPGSVAATATAGDTELRGADLRGSQPVLTERRRPGRYEGDVPAGATVHVAEAASDRWRLTVDGEPVDRTTSFGWANAFAVDAGGHAQLSYRTSPVRWLALALQAGLWAAVVVLCVRRLRRPAQERQP